jgi:hypothetical protein
MNDVQRIVKQAEALRRAYPKRLPERLSWLCDNLAIGKERMLRLMGFSAAETHCRLDLSWEELVQRWPEQAQWAEGLLRELLHLHQNDWQRLAGYFRPPNGTPTSFETGPPYPADFLEGLLGPIAQGGPEVTGQVFQYLAGRPIPTRPPTPEQ